MPTCLAPAGLFLWSDGPVTDISGVGGPQFRGDRNDGGLAHIGSEVWEARDPGERDALLISGGGVQKANEYAEAACEAAVTIGQLLDPDAKRGRPTKNVLGLQHFEMPQLFSMLNICLVWKARDSGPPTIQG